MVGEVGRPGLHALLGAVTEQALLGENATVRHRAVVVVRAADLQDRQNRATLVVALVRLTA